MVKEFLKNPRVILFISILTSPKLFTYTLKAFLSADVFEKIVLNIGAQKSSLKPLIPQALKILSTQVPIEKTIDIIKKLKKHNYKVFILSNIGENSLEIIKELHPEVFSLFDGILGTTSKDNFVKKPDTKMFQKYFDQFNHLPTEIIFIDDKKANIQAATKLGISSLKFYSGEKLSNQLEELNIFKS